MDEHAQAETRENDGEAALKGGDLFSFKPVGRPLGISEVRDEYRAMQDHLKAEEARKVEAERNKAEKDNREPKTVRCMDLTAEVAQRVCEKSGTHLLKLVSPRADGDHAILNVQETSANRRTRPIPSVNAADIPFAKILYRPLEIRGHPTRSLVDDVLNPDEVSDQVLSAFASVFGEDVLEAVQATLLGDSKSVEKLAAGEFPIIFIPRPDGGDVQITPVSPATSYMGMKRVISPFFEKQVKDGPKVPRGKFQKQAVSSKPQNISGAIGGPRTRLLAEMPQGLAQADAELYRYVRGGSFPRWREIDVDVWVLRYADMLEADKVHNDHNTRAALDRTADRLIRDAERFAQEVMIDARQAAERDGADPATLKSPPAAGTILMRRKWATENDFQKARRALSSAHFEHRLQKRRDSKEG